MFKWLNKFGEMFSPTKDNTVVIKSAAPKPVAPVAAEPAAPSDPTQWSNTVASGHQSTTPIETHLTYPERERAKPEDVLQEPLVIDGEKYKPDTEAKPEVKAEAAPAKKPAGPRIEFNGDAPVFVPSAAPKKAARKVKGKAAAKGKRRAPK